MVAAVTKRLALGVMVLAAIPAAAVAKPVALDSPNDGTYPQVAYDHVTGTTYVAWGDGDAPNAAGIELCVIAANATGCTGGSPVTLSDPYVTQLGATVGIAGIVVEPNGDSVVLGSSSEGGTGTVAWASAPGGGGFLSAGNGLQNAGKPISAVSLYYTIGNVVSLGDSDVGLLDDYGGFFSDSPFAGPASPVITATDGNSNPGALFTRKPIDSIGADIGAEPTPGVPGSETVIGVGDNVGGSSYVPPGCPNYTATGYGVSVGAVNGASNAAGTLNGDGIPTYGLLECSARAPAIASGGDKGMGVLEEEGPGYSGKGTDITMDWRPFNATSTGGSFGGAVKLQDITNHIVVSADDLQVVDDATAGVYAEWEDEQGIVLDYSSNGGVTWYPPVVGPKLSPNSLAPYDPVIVGLGSGVFDLVYDHDPGSGSQIFSDVIPYSKLVSKPITLPGGTAAKSTSFPITVVCSSACSTSVTVTVPGKGKAITIASGAFSIKAAGRHKITLKFTKAGRSLYVKDHGKLVGTISAVDKAPFGTYKDSKKFRITAKKKKKK